MAEPTKLVYIVDWLPPEFGAIGQYALKESETRAREGADVVLVGLTTGPSRVDRTSVGAGSLTIRRLSSREVDRVDLKRRALWTARTNLTLVGHALRDIVTADEILFTASPPFLEHLIVPLGPLLRGRVVFRIADVHPECMMRELDRPPAALRAFQRVSVLMRRWADVVEVLGDDQRRLLESQGVDPKRIVVRRSGSPVDFSLGHQPLETPYVLRDRAVVLYSGNVGRAHEYATFVEGFALHHQRGGRVGLWLSATGVQADAFEESARAAGLPVHRSAPVPLADLGRLLVTPAAHLVTLRDEYVGLVVPSKIYACLASGRDVLYVGSTQSDVHSLASAARPNGGYFRAGVGDAAGVARALDAICERAAR